MPLSLSSVVSRFGADVTGKLKNPAASGNSRVIQADPLST